MSKRYPHLDPWSSLIIVLTLGLFTVALLVKGFTHDLLLEAGVFLVSAKLIFMSYKLAVAGKTLEERLDGIQDALRRMEDANRPR